MTASSEISASEAATLLGTAEAVTVLCHVNPDADALGSALALGIALRRADIGVQVSFADPAVPSESLRSLPGQDLLVPPTEVDPAPGLLVVVDCGSSGRLGDLRDRVDTAKQTLVIDHHASNTYFGSANLVDPFAESTTVLVADVLAAWGVELDRDLAYCLYAGLVTDTSSFRRARPQTHELASRLIATGLNPVEVVRPLMDTHPFAWLQLLSRVLGSAVLERSAAGGRGLAYAVVPSADIGGLRSEETESIIDLVATASEAEVAAVLKQTSELGWTVSLRAKSEVDVAAAATALGGGGHRLAAGYSAVGTAEEVVAALLAVLG
ncbi:bifunctional oligoribonuclease/PAP phosphatase NrnA [Rhodococcus sp. X156]|uniref:DHH family phosphoesterase n=1 Tax=Rhodococcus sp. X156 TaxID=2499145 RepID=UPI000FDB8AB5|nr:bifunctional oligoribonuclease/PAP phosphatase NrnA [Rhodococcus sp. X156]